MVGVSFDRGDRFLKSQNGVTRNGQLCAPDY